MPTLTAPAVLTSEAPAATQAYLSEIAKVAQNFALLERIGQIFPVELGDQGQFPWYWATSENYFSERSFNWVDRIVEQGDQSSIKLAGTSFSNEYLNLLKDIHWNLSSRDREKLDEARLEAEKEIVAIVSHYEQLYGTITPAQMTTAGVETKIDYIIAYKVCQVWASQPPLELTEENIWSLREKAAKAPPSAATLLTAIQLYLTTSRASELERNLINKKNQLLKLIINTEKPAEANGGMTVADPQKNLATRVRYSLPEIAEIENKLNNKNQYTTVEIGATEANQETVEVSISGQAGITIPVADFFSLGAEAQVNYNAFQLSSNSSEFRVRMTFRGMTVYPIAAMAYRGGPGTGQGWFYPPVLQEAAANGEKDVTGYEFVNPPSRSLTKEGNFGRLTNLVISELPVVEIDYSAGSVSESIEHFQEQASVTFSFLGIPLGSASESYSWGKIEHHSSQEGFTIKLEPPKSTGSTVATGQLAYVMGATAEYPGAAG